MPESLTFPSLTMASPPCVPFSDLMAPRLPCIHGPPESCCSELSSNASTPFVSAPSSPSKANTFYFSAPASPIWARITPFRPLQREEQEMPPRSCKCIDFLTHKPLQVAHHDDDDGGAGDDGDLSRTSTFLEPSAQAELHGCPSKALRSQNYSKQIFAQSACNEGSNLAPPSLQSHQRTCSSWASDSSQTKFKQASQKYLQAEPHGTSSWYEARAQRQNLSMYEHGASVQTSKLSWVNDSRALQSEDSDLSYTRDSLYASAVPFSWEEKPGTPKARSVTSEVSHGEDDGASAPFSGSSDFEFSARFAELEEPPLSPTLVSTSSQKLKFNRAPDESLFLHACAASLPDGRMQNVAATHVQIWPLPSPPCHHEKPDLFTNQLMEDESGDRKHSHRSQSSLSAPQSPRSPRKFDIREVFCGIFEPEAVAFDPFLAAIQKSTEKRKDDFHGEIRRAAKKNASGDGSHHRRTLSSSPLRIFHWDEHFSSSSQYSSMDYIKSKHPIQREIDARYSAGLRKGSKRWSFRCLLSRNSGVRGESSIHSSTSARLHSSVDKSNLSSTSRHESCSSSPTAEIRMDTGNSVKDMNDFRAKGTSSPVSFRSGTMLPPVPSMPLSTSSSFASSDRSAGKVNAHSKSAVRYDVQRAHAEGVRKKTILPRKRSLLGCLGFSSRAIAAASKHMHAVT